MPSSLCQEGNGVSKPTQNLQVDLMQQPGWSVWLTGNQCLGRSRVVETMWPVRSGRSSRMGLYRQVA
jgi:hypothetical protein